MTDKLGTPRERRAANFSRNPIGVGKCGLRDAHLAIVPVRYALDRSHHDVDPTALTPLPLSWKGPWLPWLQTRAYTLRQLRDGFVYVFDETANTLHEYRYLARDAGLTRITWSHAQVGQDERSADGDSPSLPYLLYPRGSTLHIAFAPEQWTWRICEHMRSHADSRAQWMRRLDLVSYCKTAAEPSTQPLIELAARVADIDPGRVNEDQRFDDTSLPTTRPVAHPDAPQPAWVGLGADTRWLGNVPDKHNALLIALDDPLATLGDLGMQLAADQAAYQAWQDKHEHRLEMAMLITRLCGLPDELDPRLPDTVRSDAAMTHGYLLEAESYLAQYELEERTQTENTLTAPEALFMPRRQSDTLRRQLLERHRTAPSQPDIESWMQRRKWRREIDLQAARAYRQQQHPEQQRLLQQVGATRKDLQRWAGYIGLEPMALFIDTGNPRTLLYLQNIFEELLTLLTQDEQAAAWLSAEQAHATTLFGTLRHGFSPALKDALDSEAGKLLDGLNDFTNLATRAGELNSVLNHSGFTDAAWMKALKQPVQATFKALKELASGIGQQTAQRILLAFTPLDSRLAKGKTQNLRQLLGHLLIGQVLSNSPDKLAIDREIGQRVREWQDTRAALQRRFAELQEAWTYPAERSARRRTTQKLAEQKARLQAHEAKIPLLIDYQNNQYARRFLEDVHTYIKTSQLNAARWKEHAGYLAKQLGVQGVSVGWGVIMLNFINAAMVWEEVSRDGTLSEKDLVKVGYSIGWSFNLLMALYAEVPWPVVKNAQPVMIDNKSISILERSAAYWKARGNLVWAEAVGSFRARLLGTGLFAIGAAWLEYWDIKDDLEHAKTDKEKGLLVTKMISVFTMGIGGALQVSALFSIRMAAFVMGHWFTIYLLAAGLVYLATTMLINELKQDSIGAWLGKCCWSHSSKYRYPDTLEGHEEERRAVREIILSPQITVKRTHYTDYIDTGRIHTPIEVQDGAWIHIHFPSELRGQFILFDIISSQRTGIGLTRAVIAAPVKESFVDNGHYQSPAEAPRLSPYKPSLDRDLRFSTVMPADSDIAWQTWVPLPSNADFLEMQIWYPMDILKPSAQDAGYLYQLTLDSQGETLADGLGKTELSVRNENRQGAWMLYVIPEDADACLDKPSFEDIMKGLERS